MDKQTEQYLLQNVERLNAQVRSISRQLEEQVDDLYMHVSDRIEDAFDRRMNP